MVVNGSPKPAINTPGYARIGARLYIKEILSEGKVIRSPVKIQSAPMAIAVK